MPIAAKIMLKKFYDIEVKTFFFVISKIECFFLVLVTLVKLQRPPHNPPTSQRHKHSSLFDLIVSSKEKKSFSGLARDPPLSARRLQRFFTTQPINHFLSLPFSLPSLSSLHLSPLSLFSPSLSPSSPSLPLSSF